jgi:hypothetical protein
MSKTSDKPTSTSPVRHFRSIRAAKEYLAGRIAAEAEREGTPLSEIERKMLYFSETSWTLPDMMAVNEEFDRDDNQEEYEHKIGALIRRLFDQDDFELERQTWDNATEKLVEEDDYLLVLMSEAFATSAGASPRFGKLSPWLPTWEYSANRPQNDVVRLFLVALAATVVILSSALAITFLRH